MTFRIDRLVRTRQLLPREAGGVSSGLNGQAVLLRIQTQIRLLERQAEVELRLRLFQ